MRHRFVDRALHRLKVAHVQAIEIERSFAHLDAAGEAVGIAAGAFRRVDVQHLEVIAGAFRIENTHFTAP